MRKREPKTSGLEWLCHSLMAFNGSGYASMDSPDDYLDSYISYKTMRKDSNAVSLAHLYRQEVLPAIADLLSKTGGAGRTPSQKNISKFNAVHKRVALL